MSNYPVEVNCNGKFLIEVQASSQEEAESIAKETFEDAKVKDAIAKYKNNFVVSTKVKQEREMEI